MTALTLHPSARQPARHKQADLRSAVLAVVWLALAAAAPLGAVFVAASSPGAGSATQASPYYAAKVGNP